VAQIGPNLSFAQGPVFPKDGTEWNTFPSLKHAIHSVIRGNKARMNPKRMNRKAGTRPCRFTKGGFPMSSASLVWLKKMNELALHRLG